MSNDRLKFRVWWKKQNRYLRNPVFIFGKIGTDTAMFEDGKLAKCVRTDETEIEQCTGLKDKNRNLIYEGDIVKVDAHEENHHAHYWHNKPQTVVFTGCAFRLKESYINLWEFNDRIEIIGNVHTEEQK